MNKKLLRLALAVVLAVLNPFGMEREAPSPEAILARIYASKSKNYEDKFRADFRVLESKYKIKKEKMYRKYTEAVQMICQAKSPEDLNSISSDITRNQNICPLLHKLAEKQECHELLCFMLSRGATANLAYYGEGGVVFYPLTHAICAGVYCNVRALLDYEAQPALALSYPEARKRVDSDPALAVMLGIHIE